MSDTVACPLDESPNVDYRQFEQWSVAFTLAWLNVAIPTEAALRRAVRAWAKGARIPTDDTSAQVLLMSIEHAFFETRILDGHDRYMLRPGMIAPLAALAEGWYSAHELRIGARS